MCICVNVCVYVYVYKAPSTEGLHEDPLYGSSVKPLYKASKGASQSPFYKRGFAKPLPQRVTE